MVAGGSIIRRVIARATAAVTPAAAMQREAVRRAVIAILARGAIHPLDPLAALAVLLRLAAGDEGRQPLDVDLDFRLIVLRAWLIVLRLILRLALLRLIGLRLVLLRLMGLLLARIE